MSSPCSRPALLANKELHREAVQHDGAVLGHVDVGFVLASLRLTAPDYEDEPDRLEEVGWRLTVAEWADGILRITYRGSLPEFDVLQFSSTTSRWPPRSGTTCRDAGPGGDARFR